MKVNLICRIQLAIVLWLSFHSILPSKRLQRSLFIIIFVIRMLSCVIFGEILAGASAPSISPVAAFNTKFIFKFEFHFHKQSCDYSFVNILLYVHFKFRNSENFPHTHRICRWKAFVNEFHISSPPSRCDVRCGDENFAR